MALIVVENIPPEAAHLSERFWRDVRINTDTPGLCLDWVGPREPWKPTKGDPSPERPADGWSYGLIPDPELGRTTRVHLYVYDRVIGKRPAGKVIDHVCHRRQCCNWLHLEPVTNAVNVRRGADARLRERSLIVHRAEIQNLFEPHEYERDEDPPAVRSMVIPELEEQLRLLAQPDPRGTDPLFLA